MFKLDFEKAFDNVNWKFLIDSLKGFGFIDKWIVWIKMCIYSAKFSILVNGSPRDLFDASNGLRQGDPLSPILFIIVTRVLNRILHLGRQNDLIEDIKFPHNSPEIMNIQYIDDTLIFLEPSNCYIVNLKRILCYFQACVGLKINFHKSSLTGISIP